MLSAGFLHRWRVARTSSLQSVQSGGWEELVRCHASLLHNLLESAERTYPNLVGVLPREAGCCLRSPVWLSWSAIWLLVADCFPADAIERGRVSECGPGCKRSD